MVQFYTGAPRQRTLFERNYSDRKLRSRSSRGTTTTGWSKSCPPLEKQLS